MANNGAAAAPAAAAVAAERDVVVVEQKHSPKTMYDSCLRAFVRNRKNPELRLIRFLPPSVISDILYTVSQGASVVQCSAVHGMTFTG